MLNCANTKLILKKNEIIRAWKKNEQFFVPTNQERATNQKKC